MKVKGLLKFYLPAVAVAMGVGSCQDYNADFNEKEARYTNEFRNIFGDIDPQQDWNMAQQITATLNLPNAKGKSVVKIYEFDPLATVGAKYFTDIDVIDGKAEWKFDAFKNDKDLFVQVKQGNDRIYAGYCTIEDGQLVINKDSFHKRTSKLETRAAGGTGLGELLWTELCFEPTMSSDAVLIDRNYYQNCVKQIKIESDGFIYYSSDITSKPFRKLAYNNDTQDGYYLDHVRDIKYADGEQETAISNFGLMDYVINDGGTYKFKSDVHYAHQAHIAKTYAINETVLPTLTYDTKWLIGDCKTLFWEGDAPFAEGVDYRSDDHKSLYAKYDTSVEEIETKGVIFTTSKEDAEIEIPMMYGATDKYNILGYYYYEVDQDPRDVNRYVLFDDARPSTNIKVDDVAVTGMQLQQRDSKWKDESVVTCKTRKLMYFGRDGELNGTTKFPEGIKIGFFIHRHESKYNTGGASLPGDGGWAFSDPTLNYQHIYDAEGPNLTEQGTNWTYRGSRSVGGINSDTGKGNVKAICWNYGGRVLVGFGDDTGDCDLNDFVFWVNGDIVEKPKVNIEVKDDTDVVEWMVACEDLGGEFDYDFNDVVFGVKNYKRVSNMYVSYFDKDGNLVTTVPTVVEGINYLVVTPYAAGGSLKSHVMYNSTDLGEIHSLVNKEMASTYAGMSSGSMPILNADEGKPAYTGTPRIIDLGSTEFSMSTDNMGGFAIKTMQKTGDANGELIKAPKTGEAPQMMVLPTGWDWPTERNCIYNVYPDFENWTNEMTANGWVSSKKGSFVTNPYKTATGGNSGSDDEGGGDDGGDDTPDLTALGESISFTIVQNSLNAVVSLDNISTAIDTNNGIVISFIGSNSNTSNFTFGLTAMTNGNGNKYDGSTTSEIGSTWGQNHPVWDSTTNSLQFTISASQYSSLSESSYTHLFLDNPTITITDVRVKSIE